MTKNVSKIDQRIDQKIDQKVTENCRSVLSGQKSTKSKVCLFIRSSASPISQLPPFLLAAMTAGANGPRLDALLRQMAQGPPSKKPKVGKSPLLS